MTEHAFPSATFPGPPRIRLTVPDTWTPLRLPNVAMAFIDSASPPSVPTNAVLIVGRVSGRPTLDEIADALVQQVEGPPLSVRTLTCEVAGREARQTVLTVPVSGHAVTIVQAQTVFLLESTVEGLLDLIQVHLTCHQDVWPSQSAVLDKALDSLAVI
jgi:hypothetical protein